jgi:hypothetical protein
MIHFLKEATDFFNALNPLLTAMQPAALWLLTALTGLTAWWARQGKKITEVASVELAKNTALTVVGNAKTDTLAAALNVDTTKPASLNPDVTQPVKTK